METELRTELFVTNAYEVLQRPSQHNIISIGLTILTINGMVNNSTESNHISYFIVQFSCELQMQIEYTVHVIVR